MASRSKLDWARHEATIRRLYLDEDGSLQNVIKFMAEEHSFRATKSQYQRQFKKWDFEKNHKRYEMDAVIRYLIQRRTLGKKSRVYHCSRLIPENSIERILRENTAPRLRPQVEEQMPALPPDYEIKTPPMTPLPPVSISQYVVNLPFAKVNQQLDMLFQPRLTRRISSGAALHNFRQNDGATTSAFDTPSDEFPESEVEGLIVDTYTRGTVPNLTEEQRLSRIIDGGYYPVLPREMTDQVISYHQKIVQPLLDSLFPESIRPVAVRSVSAPGQSSTIMVDAKPMSSAYARLLIFGISNNFAALKGISHKTVWDYLRNKPLKQMLSFIKSFSDLTSKALIDKLFVCALEAEDAQGIDTFLQVRDLEIDINQFQVPSYVPRFPALRPTMKSLLPLEYASQHHDSETVKVLLKHGADVNKTLSNSSFCPRHESVSRLSSDDDGSSPHWMNPHNHGSLFHALNGTICLQDSSPFPVVTLLLDKDAAITSSVAEGMARHKDKRLLELLVNSGSVSDHATWLSLGVFENEVWCTDHSFVRDMIGKLLSSLAKLSISIQDALPGNSNLLDNLAKTGNTDSIKLLIEEHRMVPSKDTLIHAIEGGEMSLFRYLLDCNIDLFGESTEDKRYGNTVFSTAINTRNPEILETIIEKGAMTSMDKFEAFNAALEAVCNAVNTPLFYKLMELRFLLTAPSSFTWNTLTMSLHAAIELNQEEIALQLIYEADTHHCEGHKVLLNGLRLALKARNKTLTKIILQSPRVQIYDQLMLLEAVDWGDSSIIQNLNSRIGDLAAFLDCRPSKFFLIDSRTVSWRNIYEEMSKRRYYPRLSKNLSHIYMNPLVIAVIKSRKDIADLLMAAGADVNQSLTVQYVNSEFPDDLTNCKYSEPLHLTPLTVAIANNDLDMSKYLLSLGADPGDDGAFEAVLNKGNDIQQLLLHHFLQRYPNGKGGCVSVILNKAVLEGDIESVRFLAQGRLGISYLCSNDVLEKGYVRAHGWHRSKWNAVAIAIATRGARALQILRILLDGGININGIVRRGYKRRSMDSLLSMTLVPETPILETPLLVAVNERQSEILGFLLDKGANVNAPLFSGVNRTPLQRAAEIGAMETVEYLIKRSADVNAPPFMDGGATALQFAARKGFADIVNLLIMHGADVNASTDFLYQGTALQAASAGGFAGIVEALIRYGANINAKGHKQGRRSALELAAKHGRLDTVALLLAAGAKLDDGSDEPYAIRIAKEEGHKAVAQLLQTHRENNS